MATPRRSPRSNQNAAAASSSSFSSPSRHFLSRLLSLSSRDESQLKKAPRNDHDNCVAANNNDKGERQLSNCNNAIGAACTHQQTAEESGTGSYYASIGIVADNAMMETTSNTTSAPDPSVYEICDTIDDCLSSLHSAVLISAEEQALFSVKNYYSTAAISPFSLQQQQPPFVRETCEYDWILDGDPSPTSHNDNYDIHMSSNATNITVATFHSTDATEAVATATTVTKTTQRKRRLFGDDQLDFMLGILEIENQESYDGDYSVSCCCHYDDKEEESDNNVGDKRDEDNGVVDFADFSKLEISLVEGSKSHDANDADDHDEFGSFAALHDEDDVDDEEEKEDDANNQKDFSVVGATKEAGNEELQQQQQQHDEDFIIQPCESGQQTYEPPELIGCLVNDITIQLDTTIDECLSVDDNQVDENDDNNVSMGTARNNIFDYYQSDDDPSASEHLLNNEIAQSEMILLQGGVGGRYNGPMQQHQSSLMSSVLLESLPVPMPTETIGDEGGEIALTASLTRRIQRQHQASIAMLVNNSTKNECGAVNLSSKIEQEDNLIELNLADIIHPGYFEETENDLNDEHYFDSIVLEEILTVPWPFHEITDINEPFFGEEVFDSSSDDADNNDDDLHHYSNELNFDTYISNRLSQLHHASAQVLKCLQKRASEKEESINKGIQSVFATEIEIETALLFTKSSREFLHRAIHGYPVSDFGGKQQHHLHNAITGGLDVLEYSDCRDRLGLLLATVDRISFIRGEEANWWKQLSDRGITTEGIPSLVDSVRKLKQLTALEEILTNLECMKETNERINKLPGVLICLIEEILADLFDRILSSDENSNDKNFGEYFEQYKTLLRSWILCVELRDGEHLSAMEWCIAVSTEWSGSILDIFCSAVKKAVAYSMIDAFTTGENGSVSYGDLDLIKEVKGKLKQIRLKSKDESVFESLSQKLLLMRAGGKFDCTALSLTFFHLSSRIVELLTFYEVILQWHEAMLVSENEAQESECVAEDERDQDEAVHSILSARKSVSTVSSNEDSVSLSSGDTSEDDTSSNNLLQMVPIRITFKENKICSLDWCRTISQSLRCIRHALWKYCDESLILLVESFSSDSMGLCHSATSSLHLTWDVFQQFKFFSKHFNDDTGDDTMCVTLKHCLCKLYRKHLRSVHVEAMKTTGSLLSQESWQLSLINISRRSKVANCKNDHEMLALYEAVQELLLKAYPTHEKSKLFNVTTRSCQRGYKYCSSFVTFLQSIPDSSDDKQGNKADSSSVNDYFGARSASFSSVVSSLIERSPCGELTLTLLSTSSADGLLKWTGILLAIGNILPLVAIDATKAIMMLFDLYFLTAFRICASNRANEDVLIGLGRGTSVQSLSSNLMSITIEADACAALPCEREEISILQQFIQNSRMRLDGKVNLDKFQSLDQLSISSPTDQHKSAATRLEKESAAALSCLVAAVIADIASKFCRTEDMDVSIDENDVDNDKASLECYARDVISMAPLFVRQSCRLSAARSLSGKELVFKIICCGNAWTGDVFKEYSNDYIDDLCERASLLWGYICSRGRLPSRVQTLTWDHIVRSSFMLLLEGFSKIPSCSTEGRSLMSMDLATLSAGLGPDSVKEKLGDGFPNVRFPPSQCHRDESMRYVDTWIKVFFFPEEDAMNWIKQNRHQYHFDHSISIITAKISPKDKQMLALKKKKVLDVYNGLQTDFLQSNSLQA